jgi:hypothetical protein
MRVVTLAALLASALSLAVAACSSPPPPPGPVNVAPQAMATPPPITTTPVPIVKSKTVANAGRVDPFVALFGPPTGGGATPPPKVAVSTFPNIPTLPGFESAPGAGGIWAGVHLTGIFEHNGYIAILEDNGKSYFVRPGDSVDDQFRVISIGPDYITLGTPSGERHFSLGG